jgi:hypothetical protein
MTLPSVQSLAIARPRWNSLYTNIPPELKLAMADAMDIHPHAYQIPVLTDNHPDKILCCGRRWGKSYISSLVL